jgi:hypothetical protein
MVKGTSAKVEQEGKTQACCREIMHGLGMMASAKPGDGFDLNNNFTINYQICFIYASFNIFVGNRKFDLSLERNFS